jgi:two-component system, OmpR family, response regulator
MVDGARTAVVVDDDPDVRLMLRTALEAIGFVVHEAATGHGGVDQVRAVEPDLVTLDLELPGFGGVEVCRRIRQLTTAYIIMITASTDEADRLVGLATGADDYVTKPFSPREVQARVSAMFRRPRPAAVSSGGDPFGLIAPPLPAPPAGLLPPGPPPAGPPRTGLTPSGAPLTGPHSAGPPLAGPHPAGPASFPVPAARAAPGRPEPGPHPPSPPSEAHRGEIGGADPAVLRHGRLTIDVEARIAWSGDVELPLTKIEFDLLATMMGNARRVWRRETLLNIVWGGQWSDYHVVEVHIGNLRRKLADAEPSGAQLIKTVRGIGYRMTPAEPHRPPGEMEPAVSR